MQLSNPVKEKLARGETVLSMILRSSRGPETVAIARAAGFDACYVDLEHSPLSIETVSNLCAWAIGCGITPLIRVATASVADIGQALDAGAMGVIIPHVVDADTADSAVRASRYSPQGNRSWSTGQPLLGYAKVSPVVAKQVLNDAVLVAIMIESVSGVDAVEQIAATPGIDLLFIGAGDLLDDLGYPGQLRHSSLERCIYKVLEAARKHHVAVGLGGMAQDIDVLQTWLGRGVSFASLGSDTAFLLQGASSAVQALHGTSCNS